MEDMIPEQFFLLSSMDGKMPSHPEVKWWPTPFRFGYYLDTPEGWMRIYPGYWIVKGNAGELYGVRPRNLRGYLREGSRMTPSQAREILKIRKGARHGKSFARGFLEGWNAAIDKARETVERIHGTTIEGGECASDEILKLSVSSEGEEKI